MGGIGRGLAALMVASSAFASASPAVLDSGTLQLQVDFDNSNLTIREVASGRVLTVQEAPLIRISDTFETSTLTAVKKRGDSLRIEYTLPRRSGVLSASIEPIQNGVFELSFDASALKSKPETLELQFQDQPEESYYGVWETQHGGNLNNRGASADFLGTQIADNVDRSSGRSPFYMSSLGYGVYVPTVAKGHFTFGQGGSTRFSFHDFKLKYFFIYGPDYGQILSKYNDLASPLYVPPLWAFGTGWWRANANSGFHGRVKNAQENVLDDADKMRALNIPGSWMWLDRPYGTGGNDWGNFQFNNSYPDPRQMVRQLGERGYQLGLWIANKAFEPSLIWDVASTRHFLCVDQAGSALDVTKSEAYDWFKAMLDSKFVNLGIKLYKVDRGEEDIDLIPNRLKNSLNDTFVKLASQTLETRWGADHFVFSRNLNTTGRSYAALWNGDAYTTFEALRTSVTQALRAGLIGFPMWGSDTGGIIGRPSKELFARWLEFSAFTPMMEVLIGGDRTPWYDYDDELVAVARTYSTAHFDLIPYTRSLIFESKLNGRPVMRPLFLDYSADKATADLSDEYLYGPDLLVAPVVQEGATSRSVYFPEGSRWLAYDADMSGPSVYFGPSTLDIPAPLDTIPVFVKEGGIVVRGDILKANNSSTSNWQPHLEVDFFPSSGKDNQFTFRDEHREAPIKMHMSGSTLTINIADLGYAGEAVIYLNGFKSIDKNGTQLSEGGEGEDGYQFDQASHRVRIAFSGTTRLKVNGLSGLFEARR